MFGESTSGKSSGRRVWKSSALGVVLEDGTEVRRGKSAVSQCTKTARRLPGPL
jgi:hypothetical protein